VNLNGGGIGPVSYERTTKGEVHPECVKKKKKATRATTDADNNENRRDGEPDKKEKTG